MRLAVRKIVTVLAVTVVAAVAGTAGCKDEPDATTAPQALESCIEEDSYIGALLPAGMSGEAEAIVPLGRRVSPVGKLVELSYFPLGIALSPDGTRAFVTHTGSGVMEVIDTESAKVLQTVDGVGGFRGVLVSPDAKRVFTAGVAGGSVSMLEERHGKWEAVKTIHVVGSPATLATDKDFSGVIAVSTGNSRVFELDPVNLEVRKEYETHGVFPYAAAVSPDGKLLFASHVGSDTVTVMARDTGALVGEIPAGVNPMGLVVDEEHNAIYVANSDSDSLTVIPLDTLSHPKTVDLSSKEGGYVGGSPNELALSPDSSTLYISFADLNRVEMYDVKTWKRIGAIPTAHYPTGLAVSGDGALLAVLSSKGWGGAKKLHHESCILSLIGLPIAAETLKEWTALADSNAERTAGFWDSTCPDPIPLPLDQTKDRVVNHVVLIVRENKTYDAVLGDFERGNGDVALNVFGEEHTPNLHAIAREFTNLDNYYADSEESTQGHTWTTQADCNDYFEKLYPKDPAQVAFFGYDPNTMIAEGSFFDHCFDHGVTFRNYGEYMSFAKDVFGIYNDYIDHKFPFYNTSIPDVWKAEEFIRELNLGIFPEFIYIALPNDHTVGGKAGFATPASMVADNDEGTGMIVEAISKSPFWPETAIFIIEDDPQGYGGDHVHSHRSICVVAGPWVRREFTSSVHYSIPAMYRTIEMLLRLPPMHRNDAFAPPMYDIFVTGDGDDLPDSEAFDHIARLIPFDVNPAEGLWAEASEKLDLSTPDAAPGLGYIIWRMMKGDQEPPPYAKWKDE